MRKERKGVKSEGERREGRKSVNSIGEEEHSVGVCDCEETGKVCGGRRREDGAVEEEREGRREVKRSVKGVGREEEEEIN